RTADRVASAADGAPNHRPDSTDVRAVASSVVYRGSELSHAYGGYRDRVAILSDNRVRCAVGVDRARRHIDRRRDEADGQTLESIAPAGLSDRRVGFVTLLHSKQSER